MVSVKAIDLITAALKMINVIAGTETPSADQSADGLLRLNRLVDSLGIQRGTINSVQRFVDNLVASQGGPTNPYIIGTGAQLNHVRPAWIQDAAIIEDPTASIPTEIPLDMIGPDRWAAIVQKDLTSSLPTALHYQGLTTGYIFIWPVPSTSTPDLVLYVPVAVAQFADLSTTTYVLADGYQLALETNLALQLMPEYPTASIHPVTAKLASESLGNIKRLNTDPGLLSSDPALLVNGLGYLPGQANWYTGP